MQASGHCSIIISYDRLTKYILIAIFIAEQLPFFFINIDTQSKASSTNYEVYILKSPKKGKYLFNEESLTKLQIKIIPGPNEGLLRITRQMKVTQSALMYMTGQ